MSWRFWEVGILRHKKYTRCITCDIYVFNYERQETSHQNALDYETKFMEFVHNRISHFNLNSVSKKHQTNAWLEDWQVW